MNPEMDRRPENKSPEPRNFSRRDFFRILGGAGTTAALALVLGPAKRTSAAPEEDANATQVNQLLIDTGKKYGIDAVGYRISNTWRHTDGTWLMAYQGAIVQYIPSSGEINLWNTLDEATKLGLDARLDNGSLGVTIPPKEEFNDNSNGDFNVAFVRRNVHFQVPLGIQTWINNFRQQFETGVPISHLKNYGSYSVIRDQRLAAQIWTDGPNKGLIQRILVGDAMKAAGLIPASALLARPDDGNGVPEPVINPEPTSQVQVPDLPPGGIHDNQNPEELRQNVFSALRIYYEDVTIGGIRVIQSTGRISGWRSERSQVIVSINVSGANKEVPLTPSAGNTIWFVAARTSDQLVYRSPDALSTLAAFNKYFKNGDPIYIYSRLDGIVGPKGYGQKVTTWE